MNNYCRNCGEKLENDTKVCSKCNAEIFADRINVEEKKKELEEYKQKENKYIVIIIGLYAMHYVLKYLIPTEESNFISYINPLLSLSATITLIYARITMDKSKKIRLMFNIFICLIILFLVYIMIILITCANIINRGCY